MVLRDSKQTSFLARLSQPALLGVGFAILIAISAASIWLVNQARSDATEVAHTLEVQNSLAEIQIFIRRSESSQRGFLLARNPSYLQLFEDSKRDLNPEIAALTKLTADNPRQVAALADAIPKISTKMDELNQTVDLGRQARWDEALEIVKTNRGEILMRDITATLDKMKAEEGRLLEARTVSASESAQWLLLVNIVGVIAIISVASISVHLSQRTTKELRAAHRQVASINEGLEKRVAERTADLQEANQEIQSFAYIVSHDLRSPLVNIMGFTSELEELRTDLFFRLQTLRDKAGDTNTAQDEALGKDFEEAFGFIKASIIKMDRLIKAILDLSRQGGKEFRPVSVDVTDLVKNIAATVAHQLMERDATIEIAPLPAIVTDRLSLEQIFTNLIDNAVKYLRTDVPGRISVNAIETSGYITFLVSDNGRGIDPKDRGRVFELFRRSGPQDRPGEGIGLAHVRTLVRRMGGSVLLDSELGRGTTFKVTLPRTIAMQRQED